MASWNQTYIACNDVYFQCSRSNRNLLKTFSFLTHSWQPAARRCPEPADAGPQAHSFESHFNVLFVQRRSSFRAP